MFHTVEQFIQVADCERIFDLNGSRSTRKLSSIFFSFFGIDIQCSGSRCQALNIKKNSRRKVNIMFSFVIVVNVIGSNEKSS